MATTIESVYLGELRVQSVHLKSGNELLTDAPTDNHGKGEAFSPTDLVATSLLTCILTVMGIAADKQGYDMGKLTGSVTKVMADAPRRVAELQVKIDFSGHRLGHNDRHHLEQVAIHCPVAKSLHPDIHQSIQFHYD